jgi:hypothetical protein
MIRIFVDESVPVYLAGIGYETIHLDMIDTANQKGGFELKYNYKDPNQVCLLYVPFSDESFDEEGDANWEAVNAAREFANKYNCHWDSDIVRYIYSADIPSYTHCNYRSIYAWR